MDTGTSLPREVSTRGRPGRGGVPSSGDRLLTSNMRVKPGVQMPPGRRAHRMDDPDSDRGRQAPRPPSSPRTRLPAAAAGLAGTTVAWRRGVSAAARDLGPTPRHQRQLSSLVPWRPRLQGRGLLAGGWAPGSGYPGPVRPPRRPTARGREPSRRCGFRAGVRAGSLTWTAVRPAAA